jgi:hypothetical protein
MRLKRNKDLVRFLEDDLVVKIKALQIYVCNAYYFPSFYKRKTYYLNRIKSPFFTKASPRGPVNFR